MNKKISFKSYILKESADKKPFLSISSNYWSYEFDESEIGQQFDYDKTAFGKWVSKEFNDYFNNDNFDVYFDEDNELIITIELDYNIIDHNNILHWIKQCEQCYEKTLGDKWTKIDYEDCAFLCFREQIPKGVSTEWKRIMFTGYNSTETFTLEGIDKQIPKAEAIMLYRAGNVITGNVLGLLKLKSLKTIWNYPSVSIEWLDIINKHFVSKDIIACQRELIENDLDEYAEF